MKRILAVLLIVLMFSALAYGAENITGKRSFMKPTDQRSEIWMDANRMNGVMYNQGVWFYDYNTGDWGLEWPKGSGLSPIFAAGQWISAKVGDEVRVAGVIHSSTEFQAGPILSDGTPANPKDGAYKWYVLQPGGVGDWTNWPVDQGAPVDADGNPLLLGDKTAFAVYNDLGEHAEFGTNKLGVEIQQTSWAYNRADAMGDMVFMKWRLVNKSGVAWDSTYFSIWVDPDLGNATDDFVGCDPLLGLGYCYNSTNEDQNYGAAPPATGIDFFQGPIVDDPDSTVVLPDGTVLPGKKMLKMTSFIFYNNDDSNQGNPHTAGDVWNYQRGFWRDASPITDPNGNPTAFMFDGDPEANTGWLDSDAADRRFLMTTGPFTMEAWVDENGNGLADFGEPGVQDIVAGVIVARGADNLNSVTTLKNVDNLAQLAYNLNFNLAKAPLPPKVEVSELPNQVVLTWNELSEFNEDGITPYESADPIVGQAFGDTVIINNVETVIDDSTYNFYGYSVYQYSDASGRDPVLVAHWDIGGQKDAMPYTAQRFIRLLENKNPVVGPVGFPLINGKEYYFGVVAEGYLEFGAPTILPSPATIVTVVPRYEPGVRYQANYNDTLEVEHKLFDESLPPSQGSVVAWVVDPSKTTGANYQVTFEDDTTLGTQVWKLTNTDANVVVLDKQTNQTGDDAYNVVDGLMVKVLGAQPGIKEVVQVDPSDWNVVLDNNLNWSLGHQFNSTDPRFFLEAQGNDGADPASNFARWDWRHHMTPHDYVIEFVDNPETNGQLIFSGWAAAPDSVTGTWLMRGWVDSDTLGGAPTYHDTNGRLPFRVWKIAVTGEIYQINAMILDDNDDWYYGQGRNTAFADGNGFERIYTIDYPYNEQEILADGGDNVLNNIIWGSHWDSGHVLGRVVFATWTYNDGPYAGHLAGRLPVAGTVCRWNTNKPNSSNDYFVFKGAPAKSVTNNTQKVDLDKINVVPNPYYGYHSGEMDAFDRWVQFTFLPEKCTIRIFDLAGNLIRVLEKNDPTTPFLRWDLKNEYELPVASGVYVYHVDVPGVGEKVGKMAIFTPNERLDTY